MIAVINCELLMNSRYILLFHIEEIIKCFRFNFFLSSYLIKINYLSIVFKLLDF